ncbi:hypothetical protein CPB86DRAFT_788435 [Serendipita vermifera]|nr:hypothetical protein CPB86DRAFT_788435 [Serendipita vermifera]
MVFLIVTVMTAMAAPVAPRAALTHHNHQHQDAHEHNPDHFTRHLYDHQHTRDLHGHLEERGVPKPIKQVGKAIGKGWSKIKNLVKSKNKPQTSWSPPKNSLDGFRYSMAETIRDRQKKGRPSTSRY